MQGAIVILVMTIIGAIVRLVQRLTGRSGRRALARDPRPPILFLRSFDDDSAGLPESAGPGFSLREEQTLAQMFRSVGPCVAVRAPNRLLPESGAARISFRGSEWMQKVSELIEGSQLVIVRIGVSDGLLWEIDELIRIGRPRKVVLYIGSENRAERWEAFRNATRSMMPTELPDDVGDAMFVTLDERWRPTLKGTHAEASDLESYPPGITKIWLLNIAGAFATPVAFVAALESRIDTRIALGITLLVFASHGWMIRVAHRLAIQSGIVHGCGGILLIILGWLMRSRDSNPLAWLAALATSIIVMFWVTWKIRLRMLATFVSQLHLTGRSG